MLIGSAFMELGRNGALVEPAKYEYELFIVHAAADEPFVRGNLLPSLGIAADRVLLVSELRLGAPIAMEIERGVEINSRNCSRLWTARSAHASSPPYVSCDATRAASWYSPCAPIFGAP